MLKKFLKILKKVIVSALIIYSYNRIAVLYGQIIPMNVWTVGSVSILGFPCLLCIIVLKLLIF